MDLKIKKWTRKKADKYWIKSFMIYWSYFDLRKPQHYLNRNTHWFQLTDINNNNNIVNGIEEAITFESCCGLFIYCTHDLQGFHHCHQVNTVEQINTMKTPCWGCGEELGMTSFISETVRKNARISTVRNKKGRFLFNVTVVASSYPPWIALQPDLSGKSTQANFSVTSFYISETRFRIISLSYS